MPCFHRINLTPPPLALNKQLIREGYLCQLVPVTGKLSHI